MATQLLEAFVAVAETGSFSTAAERVHITQPAISKRIAQLEDTLGCRLFDRISRTIYLTEAGRALLPRAERILRELAATREPLVATHLPFPSICHVAVVGDHFRCVPAVWDY